MKTLADVPDVLGDYPGEMQFFTGELGNEQVAITYRRMPQHTGGKGSYGHYHRTQEEIYFVLSGTLQFKLGDDVVEVGPLTAVRVPPQTARSIWNDKPEDAEVLIFSTKIDDDDAVIVPDFWPE
jgi:mannose-6-phosphate isomerase-like protein (cupin superfamily)